MPKLFYPSYQPSYIILPSGWDTGWKAAKAAANTSPIRIKVFGDSIADGANAGYAVSWREVFYASLKAKLGLGSYSESYDGWEGNAPPSGSPVSTTTSNGTTNGGFTGLWFSSATTSSAYQTFTAPYACTAVDILYQCLSGHTGTFGFNLDPSATGNAFNYSIDGGASTGATTGTPVTGIAGSNDGKYHRLSITGLPNATNHQFQWGWQSASAIFGGPSVTWYNPGATNGIAFMRFGGSGLGMNQGAPASFIGTLGVSGFPLPTDLLIINTITNDISGGVALGTIDTIFSQYVRAIRRSVSNCSVLVVIPAYPDSAVDDSTGGTFSNKTTACQWHMELEKLAAHHGAGFVNIHTKWGSTPFAQGFLPATDLHPLAAGHADIASTVLSVL